MIRENRHSGYPVPVSSAAEVLGVSRSGYYRWQSRKRSRKAARDKAIVERMLVIAEENPGYGYRRITRDLCRRGHIANHKRVLRLMRENGLLYVRNSWRPITTDPEHGNPVYPNLVRGMRVTEPNQVWAADFTYIRLKDEYVYLAVELDLFGRRCIGWSLGRNIDTELALDALQKALYARRNDDIGGLIHHSDRGRQYTSIAFTECLRDHGIQVSNSRSGNPYDNAFVESFFKTLKCEEVYLNEYETYDDALQNIGSFIEDVYNRKRMHSALGYMSPVEFEEKEALCVET
jgi:transposase InsO family protein